MWLDQEECKCDNVRIKPELPGNPVWPTKCQYGGKKVAKC